MAVSLYAVDSGTTIKIDKTIILIGRHPDCDVVLTKSRKVSRKHCCVIQIDNRLVIRDLGSMNGVWVNGHRVNRQNDLSIGDEVAVGDVAFTLDHEDSAKRQNGSKSKHRKSAAASNHDGNIPIQPVEQADLSQDVPIPIPEESDEFEMLDSNDDHFDPLRLINPISLDEDDSDSYKPLADQ